MILHQHDHMAATLSDADARPSAARYRLVVAGQLGPHHASAFDEITVRAHGETDITRPIIDQSHFQADYSNRSPASNSLHSITPLDAEKRRGLRASP
ncbi:MAG: hypothetical protein ACLP0L_01255, partial [Solirubrobacteraceae bacterium]